MRVFIVYDENGEVISVTQAEVVPEDADSPFHLDNPKHSVVELDPEDEIVKKLRADKTPEKKAALGLHGNYRVNPKDKKLRKAAAAPAADDDPPADKEGGGGVKPGGGGAAGGGGPAGVGTPPKGKAK